MRCGPLNGLMRAEQKDSGLSISDGISTRYKGSVYVSIRTLVGDLSSIWVVPQAYGACPLCKGQALFDVLSKFHGNLAVSKER